MTKADPGKKQRAACALMLTGTMLAAAGAFGSAIFDGTIGDNAAGTERAGNFEIGQADGEIAGNNLFHSFSSFGVQAGEQATFSHSAANISHIIARVTGDTSTDIYGSMRVRRASGGILSPTTASLWLLNPNGIFIGDGASFDAQSSFVFSTANRLGFANGEDFYTHETTISSELSIADPTAFGFLDKQALPANVTPRGLVLAVNDTGNTNTPMLLSNMTLVGSSTDTDFAGVTIAGDIATAIDPSAVLAPADSTQYQAFNLSLGALAPGGVIAVDVNSANALSAAVDSPLAGVLVQNSNLLFSDNGVVPTSRFSVLSDQLLIQNSFINTSAALQPTEFSLRAITRASLLGSVLQTSTAGLANAGDIRIDSSLYEQIGGRVSSRVLDFGEPTGDSGNIIFGGSASLPMAEFLLQQGRIQTTSTGLSNAGDVVILVAGEVVLTGDPSNRSFVASLTDGSGDAGDLILLGNSISAEYTDIATSGSNFSGPGLISLQAGAGGLSLNNTSLLGAFNPLGTGAAIALLSEGDIAVSSDDQTASISTGTGGDLDGGEIVIAAADDLSMRGQIAINSDALGSASASGSGGDITLSGRNVSLEQSAGADNASSISSFTASAGSGATVRIEAAEALTISGEHAITSSTVGIGTAGGVLLQAADISISSPTTSTLSSSSLGAGDAGRVELLAQNTLSVSGIEVSSVAAAQGAAGVIRAAGESVDIDRATFSTATGASDVSDAPAQITVAASGDLHISRSLLQSSTGGLAPAGQVRLNAGSSLVLDNALVQSGSTGDGASGSILVSGGGTVDLMGADTELLTNSQGMSDAGDVNIVAEDTLRLSGGAVQTSAVGSGNAGTISLSAPQVRLTQGRIEGTSENAGGGDINIYGRDIQLDSNLAAGGIVFITASSESSDADGNGGSITLGDPAAPADLVLVRSSGLTASANAGNGGRININADSFLRDARSVFQVTSTLGEEGSLEINSPEQDISAAVTELDVAILDATNLIQDRCAVNAAGASSLVITGHSVVPETFDDYLASPFLLGNGEPDEIDLNWNDKSDATLQFALMENWGSKCN